MKTFNLSQNLSLLVICGALAIVPAKADPSSAEVQTSSDSYGLEDSDSLFGSYLAGRLARNARDNQHAARYFSGALEKQPDSKEILEDAFQLKIATGDFDEAAELARKLIKADSEHKVANFFLAIEAYKARQYRQADQHFISGGKGPIADLTGSLARSWVALARNRVTQAIKLTDKSDNQRTEGAQHIELLHRAMLADVAERRKIAEEAYTELHSKNPRNIRASEAYARHAAYWGDTALAEKILKPHMETALPNPLIQTLADEIKAGKKPKLIVSTADEGLTEVFQGIGEALTGDGVVDAAQIYLQLALFIDPQYSITHYSLGELYDQLKNYDLAAASFSQVSRDSPLWLNAQLRRAYDLNSLEKLDEGKVLLKELITVYPKDMRPYYTLANLLRGNKEYQEAITYYDQAIQRLGPSDSTHWTLYYARGVCYERIKDWAKAEVDLKKALELDPDQGLVLNYLGYSWVDQNLNLKEAMELIRKAVKGKPQDGYFVDSLGWAHYRQNEFPQAVKHLERAVELRPDDPVINDHLGDAYWKVGRRLEAEFQWKQALDLKPEPEDEVKIKLKLKDGLPEQTSTRAALENDGAAGAAPTQAK